MMTTAEFRGARRWARVFWLALALSSSGASDSTHLPTDLAEPKVPAQECRPRHGLPNVRARLERGDDVPIAYFGGSITAQEGWRPKSLNPTKPSCWPNANK